MLQIDFATLSETLKDKFGRKQIIALAAIAALTLLTFYLITTKDIAEPVLWLIGIGFGLIAAVGVVANITQLINDLKRPRKETSG